MNISNCTGRLHNVYVWKSCIHTRFHIRENTTQTQQRQARIDFGHEMQYVCRVQVIGYASGGFYHTLQFSSGWDRNMQSYLYSTQKPPVPSRLKQCWLILYLVTRQRTGDKILDLDLCMPQTTANEPNNTNMYEWWRGWIFTWTVPP